MLGNWPAFEGGWLVQHRDLWVEERGRLLGILGRRVGAGCRSTLDKRIPTGRQYPAGDRVHKDGVWKVNVRALAMTSLRVLANGTSHTANSTK